MNLLKQLLNDEEGQGMVEYGIIIALISVVAIATVKTLGGKVNQSYVHTSQMMDAIPQK